MRTGPESSNRGYEVKDNQAAGAIELLHLRPQIEQHPGVHQNVKNSSVQEAGRDQPPPLALHVGSRKTRAEACETGLRIQIIREKQTSVDQQDHHGGEAGVRNQAAQYFSWITTFDG